MEDIRERYFRTNDLQMDKVKIMREEGRKIYTFHSAYEYELIWLRKKVWREKGIRGEEKKEAQV